MASDDLYKFGAEFELDFDQSNVKRGEDALRSFQEVVTDLGGSAGLTDKELRSLTNRTQNLLGAFKTATGGVREVSSSFEGVRKGGHGLFDAAEKSANTATLSFQKLSTEVSKIDEEIRNAAKFAAGWGSTNPLQDAITNTGFSGEDAQKVIAQNEAMGASALKAAKGFDQQNTSTQNLSTSLPTLRYAMYDVAQTAGLVSGAITATGVGLVTVAGQYESAFTTVERTSGVTGDAIDSLRNEFMQLAREIPQTFEELTNIGARGAQLGVATDQLEAFTATVAKFVATSDTVTLQESVEAFGRISNLMGDTNFERIGSAITLVGVNAAATEAQIVKTAQELAPFATAVGMSTDEVIGLAAALGSLGQPPERARSAFLTLQRVMDTAIASGSDNLQAFANLLGKTADETAVLWKQDPGQFVEAFATSLGSVEDLTSAFADLGINERRAVQVFQALAADARNSNGELSVLSQAMQDSARGYEENTEMARQYALILDDLASKWQIFKNSLMEFAATAGAAIAPFAKVLLDIATNMVNFFSTMANNPAGKTFIVLASVIGFAVAALAALIATGATTIATLAAMQTAVNGLTSSMNVSQLSVRGLSAQFTTLAGSVRGGTTALRLFKGALISTGIGAAVVLVGSLVDALMNLSQSAEEAFNKFVDSTEGLNEALATDLAEYNQALAEGNADLANSFTQVAPEIEKVTEAQEESSQAFEDALSVLGGMAPVMDAITRSAEEQSVVIGENAIAWMRQALLANEAFQKLASSGGLAQIFEKTGADFDTAMRIALESGEAGLIAYWSHLAETNDAAASIFHNGIIAWIIRIGESLRVMWNDLMSWANLVNDFKASFGDADAEASRIARGSQVKKDLDRIWTDPVLKGNIKDFNNIVLGSGTAIRSAGKSAKAAASDFEDWGGSAENGGKKAGDAAKQVKEELRSVLDWASDLSKVWNRAFDLRFGVQNAQDATTTFLNKLREDAEKSLERIRDLRAQIVGIGADLGLISADISKTEYFLSIAIEYGDTKRAEQLQAKLTKLEADRAKATEDLQKAQKELSKEQESLNKSTQGNSQSAIDNRKTLQDLFKTYQGQLQAYAESGVSQKELERISEQLRKEFIRQATQLGYTREDTKEYEKALRDLTVIIQKVPRNVSPSMEIRGLDSATAALKEFFTKMENDAARAAQNAGNSIGGGLSGGIPGGGPEKPKTPNYAVPIPFAANSMEQAIGAWNHEINSGRATLEEAASKLGMSTSEALAAGITRTGRTKTIDAILMGVSSSENPAKREGTKVGTAVGTSSSAGVLSALTSRLVGGISQPFISSASNANRAGANVGTSSGSSFANQTITRSRGLFSSGLGSAVSAGRSNSDRSARGIGDSAGRTFSNSAGSTTRGAIGGQLGSALGAANFRVHRDAMSLGRAFASGFRGGASNQFYYMLGGRAGRGMIRALTGFAGGGFTGRGGKYEPKGIVHGGEYVVRKELVNQRTGLPYASAMESLARGSQPASQGYANGGFVSGGRGLFPDQMNLAPATIQALAAAIDPRVILDGRMVGESASKFYTQESVNGAY